MDFAILGPLEVRHDGETVPIPGRHAPKLLAVLLLDAGRLVTVNRLIEAVWGDDPPATARRQVQNVLAALRRALPRPEAIQVGTNGYRLALDGDTLDQREFQRLRTEARQAEPRQAARKLTEALRLWRGAALSGLTGSVIEAAAAKLDEERLAVVEDRVELGFKLDRNGDAAEELRDLVEAHPYRQRLAGLLMRAHWYAERTPEALAVYERTRERLAEELGLDPDPELTRLYTAIRRGEPDRDPPRAPATGPVPAQLPAAPSTFTGRREHVAELDELLERGGGAAVVSAIAGMGGAGKTALALHWGHRVRDRFPDGQLYINLRGYDDGEPVAPVDALARFLVALGQPSTSLPSDVESASTLFRSLLAKRRMLVVLDNARTVEQVRPLLPGGVANFALVTSRDSMTGLTALDDAKPIRLDTLSREESVELMGNIVGLGRLRAEPEQAQRLAELCGYLPLALRIAAANITIHPQVSIAEFVSRLGGPDRLAHLSIEGDPTAAVEYALDLSYAALDGQSQSLLLQLAIIPGADFSHELATHLSRLGKSEAEQSLANLTAAHLIERHTDARYRFHDLTREYARSRALESLEPHALRRLQQEVIDWYEKRYRTLPSAEGPNLVAVFNAWSSHPDSWKAAVGASTFWSRGIAPATLVGLCRRAVRGAAESKDPEALPRTYNSLAVVHRGIGDHVQAVEIAQKALAAIELNDVGDATGRYRGNLAIFIDELGQPGAAEPLLREALRCATESRHRLNMRVCAGALGNTCRVIGKFTEAESYLRMAIDLADRDSGHQNIRVPWFQMGELFLWMGRIHDAMHEFDDTIMWADSTASVRYQILARIRRAEALRRLKKYRDANRDLTVAVGLCETNGHENLIPEAHVPLVELLAETGDHDAAYEILDSLPRHDSEVPNQELRAQVAQLRGGLELSSGHQDAAVSLLLIAHDIYGSMPSPLMQARVLASLGSALHMNADTEGAKHRRQQALDIFTRLGVPEAEELRELLNSSH